MTTPSKPLAIGPRSPRLQGDDAEENANSRPPATGTPLQPTLLNQQLLEPTTRVGTPLSSTPIDLRALRAQYAAAAGGTPPPNIPLRPVPIGATPATATPLSQQLFEASIASSSPRVGPTFALGVGGLNQRRPGTPTVGTPGASASPYVGSYASSGVATPIGLGIAGPSDASVQQPVINLEDLPDEEKARVLRRHLVSKEERVAALAKDRPESVAGSDHVPADGASGSEQPQQKPLGLIAQLRKSLGGGKVENETTLAAGPSTTDRSRRSSAAGSSSNVHTKHDTEPFPIPYHAPGADITCVLPSNALRFFLGILPPTFTSPSMVDVTFVVTTFTNGNQINGRPPEPEPYHTQVPLDKDQFIHRLATFTSQEDSGGIMS